MFFLSVVLFFWIRKNNAKNRAWLPRLTILNWTWFSAPFFLLCANAAQIDHYVEWTRHTYIEHTFNIICLYSLCSQYVYIWICDQIFDLKKKPNSKKPDHIYFRCASMICTSWIDNDVKTPRMYVILRINVKLNVHHIFTASNTFKQNY